MYAIIRSGDKQFKVEIGQEVELPLIEGKIGETIEFPEVLMVKDGDKTIVGQPTVKDAIVTGKILKETKSKKLIVFKFKKRKRYRVKNGHRQKQLKVKIEDIKV